MAKHSNDWRETERRLNELPDDQLRVALAKAGVRAVLPSHKKPRQSVKLPGRMGDATTRWAKGDWEDRIAIDVSDLPDAQKFMDDPNKPPTLAVQRATPLASRPVASRPWRGLLWGLAGTAAALGVLLFALRDRTVLERPQITTRTPQPAATVPAPAAKAPQPAAQKSEPAHAERPEESAAPAGSHQPRVDPEEDAAKAERLRRLEARARRGELGGLLGMARAKLDAGDAHAAIKWASRAKAKMRSSIQARILLGDAQMLAGYDEKAEETWRGALARQPGNDELRKRLNE